jgi:anti-sigma B factor antagonist
VERSSGAAPPRRNAGGGIEGTGNGQLLKVRVERADAGAVVVALSGELDLSTIPMVEGPLLEQLRKSTGVIVDLTGLSFIDSCGIGMLIGAFRAADEELGLRTVIAPGSQVERVLRLAGVDRALPLYIDREQALDALAGNGRDGAAGG